MGKYVKRNEKRVTSLFKSLHFAVQFYLTEVLYLANIFAQYFFLDHFLDGHLSDVAFMGLDTGLYQSVLPITAHCSFKS